MHSHIPTRHWPRAILPLAVILLGFTALGAAEPAKKSGVLDPEEVVLRPGLVANYCSIGDAKAGLWRIDAKPAFYLGRSSPHPRLPPGPFEVVWTGAIDLAGSTPVSFDAFVAGELTVEVDGVVVLQGRSTDETSKIGPSKRLERPGGVYRLQVRYKSPVQGPARLQIWWQGDGFAREPLPAWRLKHTAADEPAALADEQLADKGRLAVGWLGCARCHQGAFPGVSEPPPGPALADLGQRVSHDWLLGWLADPAKVRPGAHMPALFAADRSGEVERWLIADHLLGPDVGRIAKPEVGRIANPSHGTHRMGRRYFISNGCAACHQVPDEERAAQPDLDRFPLTGLKERWPAEHLAAYLSNPQSRYPDGRMPRLPLTPEMTRDLAAYLLEYSPATKNESAPVKPPTGPEIAAVAKRLNSRNQPTAVATALLAEKGCAQCHTGLGPSVPHDLPLRADAFAGGCLAGNTLPRFKLEGAERKAVLAYLPIAASEKHLSPFASRQRLLEQLNCVRCHQRDADRPPPLEAIGSTLGGAWLQNIPFQRTPRLTNPHQKYTRAHLRTAIAEGVSGLRAPAYTYRMPAFGPHADAIVQALAEADGELPDQADPPARQADDRTLGTLTGSTLAGFQGYSCISCHVWNGKQFAQPDPGAVGTDLTRLSGRLRRDWFDRHLENPARTHPGTPMPSIFMKGKPAMLASILDGDAARQKDALWGYFALGKAAPEPQPAPPLPIAAPARGEPALVAQIPVRMPDGEVLESICILTSDHDLAVYDLGTFSLHSIYSGGRIERSVVARLRNYRIVGKEAGKGFRIDSPLKLINGDKVEALTAMTLLGYDRSDKSVRIRWRAEFGKIKLEFADAIVLTLLGGKRVLARNLDISGLAPGLAVEIRSRSSARNWGDVDTYGGKVDTTNKDGMLSVRVSANSAPRARITFWYDLPPALAPPSFERAILPDTGNVGGSLERPGYKAIAYPRPKTVTGEDLIMPGAVAVNPKDGRVFVASMKTGSLYVLNDPSGDGKNARFDDYARGLFQEAYSMLAEPDALYVLHRRNLTRITESRGSARGEHFERIFAVEQGVVDTYDYGYGLVRDKNGAFVFTQAPHGDRKVVGAGNAVRLVPGQKLEDFAYGFRNPVGWCTGTDGEIFCTDNQGEWVATNKLCHLEEGRFFGYPNREQPRHAARPMAKTTVWVPYGWAKSLNGVTCDTTGGKFGPFAGQFFIAELMFGGAIIRADVEKVNGVYQGVCFPFWGNSLLGPLTLAFDPKGRLYVGSITEPGWMAQPDRGALFRIDFTGQVPFEMQTIRVLPRGFRIHFTQPVDAKSAADLASYRLESFRYEYTGAYGSPELDRSRLTVESVKVATDGRSADLLLATPLAQDRVFMIEARGVRSAKGETLVQPTGAYTLHEAPKAK